MIGRKLREQKIRNSNFFVEPDEIFLDSENLQNFDRQQFEGRIEKPISKKTLKFTGVFFSLFLVIFFFRLGYLEIQKGEIYLLRSQSNVLKKQIIFSDRGIIYDRNKIELAWNKKENTEDSEDARIYQDEKKTATDTFVISPTRTYLSPGFSHTLGYVSYPMKDKTGNYWQTEFIGKDGLEKQYDSRLKGKNGSKIVEIDAHGTVHSENTVDSPVRGTDLSTTLDARIQKELYSLIKNLSENNSFSGGAGILIDVKKGEILASVSFPEYDSLTLSLGNDTEKIETYLKDKRKFFLDRTISGLYTPGSIVKPFFAIGALNEGIIDPNTKILSTGSISIPNPYFKGMETVFRDWKAHGWTDMREAIAVSSDVYFYEIGGGFENQKGLGIANIEKYARLFGIGTKTGIDLPDEKEGVIPNPLWKIKNFNGEVWRIGDTYHTSIGQYGFQVTPMEMVRAVSAIANLGTLITPHYILDDVAMENKISKIDLKKEDFAVIHEGMRQSVTSGTSILLDVPFVKVAAKTGTAQLGVNKNKVNSWIVGFFPYENPKYAFTIMMEAGPSTNSTGAPFVMRKLLDWMSLNSPEYFL